MAVKIFCNACQKYIRDAKRDEIPSLKGTEICEACEQGHLALLDQVEKIAKRGIVQIENKRDKVKADIDEAVRKVVRADGENA
jgi:hypothetical protein